MILYVIQIQRDIGNVNKSFHYLQTDWENSDRNYFSSYSKYSKYYLIVLKKLTRINNRKTVKWPTS